MYTILVRQDDTLIATVKQNIMHRSSMVRQLRFLVDPIYGNQSLNMTDYVCILEYRTPISHKYTPVVLTPSEELYKDKLEYVLTLDTKITAEVGEVELKLIWTKPEMLADGSFNDYVRKTASTSITVLPVEQWSDYIADSDLDSIAQMILTTQAQTEQLKVYADYLQMSKADGIKYNKDTNELTLTASGNVIDTAHLEEDCDCEDGIPVVEFGIKPEEEKSEVDNVVEF